MKTQRTRGTSLVEVVIAVTIMGSAAVMYATGWNLHRGQTTAAREIEIATELYVRQVEAIKRRDPTQRNDSPFAEAAFQENGGSSCAPTSQNAPVANWFGHTQYRTLVRDGAHQLHPPLNFETLLTDGINGRPAANAFVITPANDVASDPWRITLPAELVQSGYSVTVCCQRVTNLTAPFTLVQLNGDGINGLGSSFMHNLIKFCVRVDHDRGEGGGPINILTHEFLKEVRPRGS